MTDKAGHYFETHINFGFFFLLPTEFYFWVYSMQREEASFQTQGIKSVFFYFLKREFERFLFLTELNILIAFTNGIEKIEILRIKKFKN